jgi:hypothetical protein
MKEFVKIFKIFNSDDGFFKADQDKTKKYCQTGWIGCTILQVAQNVILGFQSLAYFCNPLIKSPRLSRTHLLQCQIFPQKSIKICCYAVPNFDFVCTYIAKKVIS